MPRPTGEPITVLGVRYTYLPDNALGFYRPHVPNTPGYPRLQFRNPWWFVLPEGVFGETTGQTLTGHHTPEGALLQWCLIRVSTWHEYARMLDRQLSQWFPEGASTVD
jgi:hypothetical protein